MARQERVLLECVARGRGVGAAKGPWDRQRACSTVVQSRGVRVWAELRGDELVGDR
jgi:hypothetical protein